jgi:molybdate transport system ATP-binding protein
MNLLTIEDLHINLGEFCLKGVSLSVEKGDYLSIIGPTGAGKTILLESIIGFWRPDKGRIFLEGEDITYELPERRRIGIVYQDYALLPHFTVFKNIAYGLKKRAKTGIEEKVRAIATSLRIDHLLHRKPDTLSGGEQQRAALARALVVEPRLLLMDEPFSALDSQTRKEARHLLRRVIRERGTTVIHITHDLDDAWVLAEKIAVVREGKLIQFGTLEEVFNRPKSKFIADFVGANILDGKVLRSSDNLSIVSVNGFHLSSKDEASVGSDVRVAIRPENIVVVKDASAREPTQNILETTLMEIVNEASETFVKVLVANNALERLALKEGDRVYALIRQDNVRIVQPP